MPEYDLKPKARIIRDPTRSAHRSTIFYLQMDISPLVLEDGTAAESEDVLEGILYDAARRSIRNLLEQGRAAIPNHP